MVSALEENAAYFFETGKYLVASKVGRQKNSSCRHMNAVQMWNEQGLEGIMHYSLKVWEIDFVLQFVVCAISTFLSLPSSSKFNHSKFLCTSRTTHFMQGTYVQNDNQHL